MEKDPETVSRSEFAALQQVAVVALRTARIAQIRSEALRGLLERYRLFSHDEYSAAYAAAETAFDAAVDDQLVRLESTAKAETALRLLRKRSR